MTDPVSPDFSPHPHPPAAALAHASNPVRAEEPHARARKEPEQGVGLCLSGGGYRAMLFHLGTLWRLNELGWLARIDRVSSVSGGSITAGVLGAAWGRLRFAGGVAENFGAEVIEPVRRLAGVTIDVGASLRGALLPGTASDRVVKAYDRHLFHGATLQDLPAPGAGPRFILNATNVQTGSLWRFSRPYMGDWRVGQVPNPTLPLAVAVAASSAFPPVLSPLVLKLPPGAVRPFPSGEHPPLHQEPYTTRVVLSDGGVYDNMGLETVWKRYHTVLVSDGGQQMDAEPAPKHDWLRHSLRITGLLDNQVRSLRRRQVVGSLAAGERSGAYWRIPGDILHYPAPDKLPCPRERTLALAATSTRLAKLDTVLQERIVNWGYALCDAAMRSWVDPALPPPEDFPYPAAKV